MEQEPNIEENEEVRQQDPQELARRVALEAAERPEDVGPFLAAHDMGENVFDYRFVSDIKGYEGWQWSVTLYHDPELGSWTVDEASLLPTDQSLLAPDWIPWKDRIKPEDLSPTDVLGTQADDPRIEDGLGSGEASEDEGDQASEQAESQVSDQEEDRVEAVESFMLSRCHVMTAQAREETARRWYNGPHGPKSLSTQAAEGNVCETCAFFIPLQGQLGSMFGVCANKWSQDDGRVVSLDHGCGGHSEIEPPEPTELWVQSDLRLDDSTDIEVVPQVRRDENDEVEIIEESETEDADSQDQNGESQDETPTEAVGKTSSEKADDSVTDDEADASSSKTEG